MEMIIGLAGGLAGGVALAVIVQTVLLKKRKNQILKDAEKEGENLKKNKIFQAKEKFLKLKEDHERKIKDRERKLQSSEDRIKSKEKSLTQKLEEANRKDRNMEKSKGVLEAKIKAFETKQSELDKVHQKHVTELSKVSGMSAEDAKASLVESLKDEARTSAMAHVNEIVEESKLNANREARKIVIQTIQRVATEQAIENSVSVFNIESDEVKGRIIGREGRNIRALEAATGVEIIVMILQKRLFYHVLIRYEERSLVWHCTSWYLMEGFTQLVLKKWWRRPRSNWTKKLLRLDAEHVLI